MLLTIITPERTVFKGDVNSVIVPGRKGRFEILNNHAAILSSLQPGIITYQAGKKEQVEIISGFVRMQNNEITICAELPSKK